MLTADLGAHGSELGTLVRDLEVERHGTVDPVLALTGAGARLILGKPGRGLAARVSRHRGTWRVTLYRHLDGPAALRALARSLAVLAWFEDAGRYPESDVLVEPHGCSAAVPAEYVDAFTAALRLS